MTQNLPTPPTGVPESFFTSLEDSASAVQHKLAHPAPSSGWQPQKIQYWYDSIIDWMFANPGGNLKDCAAALGRAPATISLIARSDLFKSRYAARRALFSQELDHRLVGKLANVAELGLDLTLDVLRKKRDSVPLPLLNQITNSVMDRLGYGPQQGAPSPAVVIHNNNSANAQAANVPETVTPDALARARAHLATLQSLPSPPLLEGSTSTTPSSQGEPVEAGEG